jgi:hypothetical protein
VEAFGLVPDSLVIMFESSPKNCSDKSLLSITKDFEPTEEKSVIFYTFAGKLTATHKQWVSFRSHSSIS